LEGFILLRWKFMRKTKREIVKEKLNEFQPPTP